MEIAIGLTRPDALGASLNSYLASVDVMYAEPDHKMTLRTAPNDPDFPTLWALENTGQTIQGQGGPDRGTPGADIRAVDAWEITAEDPELLIAVIDSGVDYTHEDLVGNIWNNPAEQPGDASSDGCPGFCGVGDDQDGDTNECRDELPSIRNGHDP